MSSHDFLLSDIFLNAETKIVVINIAQRSQLIGSAQAMPLYPNGFAMKNAATTFDSSSIELDTSGAILLPIP